MEYRKVRGETLPEGKKAEISECGVGAEASYQVYDGKVLAAEFTCHIQSVHGNGLSRFWIDALRLVGSYGNAATMDAVLQFIQYKCRAAGCPAMFVVLDQKNLFYMEMYQRFGFYMIDQEERALPYGQIRCESVFKYPIPVSREDAFRSYILRSERARAKTRTDQMI